MKNLEVPVNYIVDKIIDLSDYSGCDDGKHQARQSGMVDMLDDILLEFTGKSFNELDKTLIDFKYYCKIFAKQHMLNKFRGLEEQNEYLENKYIQGVSVIDAVKEIGKRNTKKTPYIVAEAHEGLIVGTEFQYVKHRIVMANKIKDAIRKYSEVMKCEYYYSHCIGIAIDMKQFTVIE